MYHWCWVISEFASERTSGSVPIQCLVKAGSGKESAQVAQGLIKSGFAKLQGQRWHSFFLGLCPCCSVLGKMLFLIFGLNHCCFYLMPVFSVPIKENILLAHWTVQGTKFYFFIPQTAEKSLFWAASHCLVM